MTTQDATKLIQQLRQRRPDRTGHGQSNILPSSTATHGPSHIRLLRDPAGFSGRLARHWTLRHPQAGVGGRRRGRASALMRRWGREVINNTQLWSLPGGAAAGHGYTMSPSLLWAPGLLVSSSCSPHKLPSSVFSLSLTFHLLTDWSPEHTLLFSSPPSDFLVIPNMVAVN
ncbi:hypothetical protein DPEC_G00173450 [Dallia pectoralis]|uniref:Uncharacterized protein n=1 Tax=Dallia pectoralis TaxID=75939 RepID=A0ACC2GDX6_DALPE|nr:hypothetical protein DPEC_G00173450 [Dallia pectoralis]